MGRPTRSYLYSIASRMDPLDPSFTCACTSDQSHETTYPEYKPHSPPLEESSVPSSNHHAHLHNHPRLHSRSYLRSVNPVEGSSTANGQRSSVPYEDYHAEATDRRFDPDDLGPLLDRYAMLDREATGAFARPRHVSESGRVEQLDTENTAEPMDTDDDEEDEENDSEENGGTSTHVEYNITFSPAPREMFEPSRTTLPTRLDQLPTLSAVSLLAPSSGNPELPLLGAPYTFSVSPAETERRDNDEEEDHDNGNFGRDFD